MSTKKKNGVLINVIALAIIAMTVVSIFTPDVPILRKTSEYTVQLTFFMLGLGMMFLILNRTKLMLTSLMCCAALCLFLKNASNNVLVFPDLNTESKLKVIHINVSSVEDRFAEVIDIINKEKPDFISFQEVTPDWSQILRVALSKDFPFHKSMERIDPYGLAVYSSRPVEEFDIFYFKSIPNLKSRVNVDGRIINVFCSYLTPSLDRKSTEMAVQHLDLIADKVLKEEAPCITVGDFNMVYWTNEIMDFRSETSLLNSRREVSASKLKIPYDHIFYSADLECASFKSLEFSDYSHLGIAGTYQFRNAVSFIESEGNIGLKSKVSKTLNETKTGLSLSIQ